MVSDALPSAPMLEGVQASATVHVAPGVIAVPVAQVPPVTATPEPAPVMAEGVAAESPVFVTVMVSGVLTPTRAVPNAPLVNVRGPACTPVPDSDAESEALVPPE